MTLKTPDGYVNPEWQDLARKLTAGDGLNWQGDPDLCLALGVITRAGRPIGHRLEVWKYTNQGESVLVGHWHPSESWRIVYDLVQMDPRSRGFVPMADRVDAHNTALEKAAEDAAHEHLMQGLEHAAYVHVRKHEGRWKHGQMGGSADAGAPAVEPSIDGIR